MGTNGLNGHGNGVISHEKEEGAPQAVADLAASCVRFVERRYGVTLDFSPDTLSLLDQYVRDARGERGEKAEAERVYSAIVELLPRDPDAQRALATLLKQRGDLPAAHDRLIAAALGTGHALAFQA